MFRRANHAPAPALCLPAPEAKNPPSLAVRLFHLLLICTLVVLIYGQTGHFDFLEWDDVEYVRDNPHVLGGLTWNSFSWALTSLQVSNWHPLTWWSHQFDVSLFGPDPGAMHLVNLVFHALNSALVYVLFVRFGIRTLLSLLAALIFAVHPLHVESVAWIAERKDLLSTFFLLTLLLAWDRYVRSKRARFYCLALVLAALGLMSKAMLVSVPCVLLVLDGWPYARLRSPMQAWFRDRLVLRRCFEKIPFFILAAVCAWLTVMAQHAGGAVRSLDAVSLADRLGNAVVSYAAYLATTLAPVSQSFMYLFTPPHYLWVFMSFGALGLVSWWALKQGKAPLAGWLWFLVTLLPVIGLIKVGEQARADRYMYLPMIGLLLMLAGTPLASRGFGRPGTPRILMAAACAAIVALSLAAWRYTAYWQDSETLFQQALSVDPNNHIAHALLAVTYEHKLLPRPTLDHADAALRLAPRSIAAASAAVSASNAALLLNQPALARNYLERAIASAPGLVNGHYNLGTLALKMGNPAEAITHFNHAIAIDPRYSEAYNNLGVAWIELGQSENAIAAFSNAVRNNPANQGARDNLLRVQGVRTK